MMHSKLTMMAMSSQIIGAEAVQLLLDLIENSDKLFYNHKSWFENPAVNTFKGPASDIGNIGSQVKTALPM